MPWLYSFSRAEAQFTRFLGLRLGHVKLNACMHLDLRCMRGECRRSGNMGSKPSKQDPFSRAEVWLRQRKDAKIDAHDSSARSLLVRIFPPCHFFPAMQNIPGAVPVRMSPCLTSASRITMALLQASAGLDVHRPMHAV